jgi:hypothetical protein
MTGYELSRNWFNWAFENKDAKVQHTALYLWIVELNNRLGWKKEFAIPTIDTMEGLSIGNKSTYLSALKDLKHWGFIKIIKESKNQYQACIISLCHYENDTAQVTALDTALIMPYRNSPSIDTSIDTSIGVSIAPIDKPINKETIKPVNKEKIEKFDVEKYLIEQGISIELIKEFIQHRKNKKAPINKIVMNGIEREAKNAQISLEKALETIIERNWIAIKAEWLKPNSNNFGLPIPKPIKYNFLEGPQT